MKMLKNLALWLIVFGMSFLVSGLGLAEQGEAFMYIQICIVTTVLLIWVLIALLIEKGLLIAIRSLFSFVLGIGIALFASFVTTKLYNIDFYFYIVYQIITLALCFFSINPKKDT